MQTGTPHPRQPGKPLIGAAVLCVAVAGFAQAANAAVTFDLAPVDNSAALSGYVTYDLSVTTDSDWSSAGMVLELASGQIYQHPQGADTWELNEALVPMYPGLAFDSYVNGYLAGGAGDIDKEGAFTFGTDRLDVSWFNLDEDDTGAVTIGRVTMTDDAAGTLALVTAGQRFDVVLSAGAAPVVTEFIEPEAPEEPRLVGFEPVPYDGSLLYPDWEGADQFWWPRYSFEDRYVAPSAYPGYDPEADPRLSMYYRNLDKLSFLGTSDKLRDYNNTLIVDTTEGDDQVSGEQTLPEPGALALLGVGAVWALGRRGRG